MKISVICLILFVFGCSGGGSTRSNLDSSTQISSTVTSNAGGSCSLASTNPVDTCGLIAIGINQVYYMCTSAEAIAEVLGPVACTRAEIYDTGAITNDAGLAAFCCIFSNVQQTKTCKPTADLSCTGYGFTCSVGVPYVPNLAWNCYPSTSSPDPNSLCCKL